MNPPLEPWTDPTLEARVVAFLLGEASAFEKSEVDRLLSESPELAAFARRIRAVHGLLGETTRGGAADLWKMEPERRGKLLLALGAPAPASQAIAMPAPKKRRFHSQLLAFAAAIAFGLIAASVFFSAGAGGQSKIARFVALDTMNAGDKEMVPLDTELPRNITVGTPKDLSGTLAAHEAKRETATESATSGEEMLGRPAEKTLESNLALRPTSATREGQSDLTASATSKPSSSASVITARVAPPPPPSAPAPLVAVSRFKVNDGRESDEKQVAIKTKQVEVLQKNNKELGYDWFVADESGKAQGGPTGWLASQEGAERDAQNGKDKIVDRSLVGAGSGSLTLSGGNTYGGATDVTAGALVEFDGFVNMGAPINGPIDGRRSGDAPVTRGVIDSILDGKKGNPDELARREDVAKVEVIREFDYADFGATLEVKPEPEIVAGAGGRSGNIFPVTPATPTDFEEKVDPFGNSMIYPTEYEPPELPNSVGETKEDVSKVDPREVAQLDDLPLVGRLFKDRWEETPPAADAQPDQGLVFSGKLKSEGEKVSGDDVDPFAAAPDEAVADPFASDAPVPADPFAAEPPKPEVKKEPAQPEKQAAASMENKLAEAEPVSTFSLNVSDASFQIGARALLGGGAFPAPESVRAEDYVNAMDYGDAMPGRGEAVSAVIQQSGQPFVPGRNLVRIGVRTASAGRAQGQPLSLVLLVDQSGSMERPDRAAAMDRALRDLSGLLGKDDTLTVIGFAREPHLLADRWSGERAAELPALIRSSPPQGGTNLEAAFDLAAEVAARQSKPGAQNRVVLFTDGAANLGQVNPENLAARVDALRRQRIAFDACGVGTADLADTVLEAMARRGDGRYLVLDAEGETSLAKQLAGAFRPAARNVKVQVRFNPERVEAYQLFGFEKHLLNEEDFRDDTVDAAELAAAEQGNALYQVSLRADGQGDIGDVAVRFQDTTTGRMVERHWTIAYDPSTPTLEKAEPSMQLAAAAGLLAEHLRGSPIGQSIDPATLAGVQADLRSTFPGDSRVATLLAMWDRVRQAKP